MGPEFLDEFNRIEPALDALGKDVCGVLERLCDGLAIHKIEHRVKKPDSLRKKAQRLGTANPSLSNIHDVLGVRVITYFPDDVDAVGKHVRASYKVDRANSPDKRKLLRPDQFGYQSLHFVVTLDDDQAKRPENAAVADRKFEIQIRSLLQHGWAEVEHGLGYKSLIGLPRGMRRRFSRVAGLLEVGDDEFLRLRRDVARRKKGLVKRVAKGDAPIDGDSVALFTDEPAIADFDKELWRRFGRPTELEQIYEPQDLAEELRALGMKTIGEVRTAWEDRQELIERFVEEWRRQGVLVDDAPTNLSLFCLVYLRLAESKKRAGIAQFFKDLDINEPGRRTALAKVVADVYEAIK